MTSAPPAIRAFDYVEQFASLRTEILAAIEAVLDSGSLILGPRVRQFEQNFARYLGADGHAIGVGNGTDALAIALRALDIGPGDEVITVANTAIPTVSAIRMAGATPVFADVDPASMLINLADVAERITPRTRAIVAVHLYGNAVDMPQLMDLAGRHRLAVVEDCAQSCGTVLHDHNALHGQHTGTFGDVGCFSFYPTKTLGAYGDGGLCFTRRADLADAIRRIRVYGCDQAYDAQCEGVNSRLDELQAAILDVKLRHLADFVARRRAIASVYREHLDPRIVRQQVAPGVGHSYHQFVIAVKDRDAVTARLTADGIGFGIHYPTPIHRMRAYDFLKLGPGSLRVTERLAAQVLSLPCYPELSHEAARRVCSAVNHVA